MYFYNECKRIAGMLYRNEVLTRQLAREFKPCTPEQIKMISDLRHEGRALVWRLFWRTSKFTWNWALYYFEACLVVSFDLNRDSFRERLNDMFDNYRAFYEREVTAFQRGPKMVNE